MSSSMCGLTLDVTDIQICDHASYVEDMVCPFTVGTHNDKGVKGVKHHIRRPCRACCVQERGSACKKLVLEVAEFLSQTSRQLKSKPVTCS